MINRDHLTDSPLSPIGARDLWNSPNSSFFLHIVFDFNSHFKRIRLNVKLQKAAFELVTVHGLPLTIFGFEAFRELTQLIFKKIDISFNRHNAVGKLKFQKK